MDEDEGAEEDEDKDEDEVEDKEDHEDEGADNVTSVSNVRLDSCWCNYNTQTATCRSAWRCTSNLEEPASRNQRFVSSTCNKR